MDRRERMNDPEETLRAAMDGRQASFWTSLPGIIVSFNGVAQTAVVQPAIMGQYRSPTGALIPVKMPLLLDCPVKFPSGGGFTLTFPIAADDECEVTFASRCIDAWWQQGGIQPPAEFRMHDLSDGFVFVGPRSQPRVISGLSTTTAQLRSDDGLMYIELAGAHVMNIVAPGGLNIDAPTLRLNGQMIATGEGTFNGHTVTVHKHGGVTAGGAQTATPTG